MKYAKQPVISVDDPISYPAVNRTSGEKPPPEGKTTPDDIGELEPSAIHSIQTLYLYVGFRAQEIGRSYWSLTPLCSRSD